ncbi:uncharacterized protein LOC131231745 [Magnolia sinica]|uniref:uncharacterized protein LOC131231745 n=1 Tax=Magnolia sinica TaxID=86752 RepID=UPI002657F99C|nr:uncharacterized protein LOC131231745 [Magnolia sinica]
MNKTTQTHYKKVGHIRRFFSGGPSPSDARSTLKKKACYCLSLPLHLRHLVSPSPVLDLSPSYSLDLSPFLSLRLSISLSSLSLDLSFPRFLRRVVPSSICLQQSKKVEERRENRSCNHQDGRRNVFYRLRLFGGNIRFMVLRMKRSTRGTFCDLRLHLIINNARYLMWLMRKSASWMKSSRKGVSHVRVRVRVLGFRHL